MNMIFFSPIFSNTLWYWEIMYFVLDGLRWSCLLGYQFLLSKTRWLMCIFFFFVPKGRPILYTNIDFFIFSCGFICILFFFCSLSFYIYIFLTNKSNNLFGLRVFKLIYWRVMSYLVINTNIAMFAGNHHEIYVIMRPKFLGYGRLQTFSCNVKIYSTYSLLSLES